MAHSLMNEAVSEKDFEELISFLQTKPKVTAGTQVRKFEENWSNWLGTKYSVFVNSGSSANILTWKALKTRAVNKTEVIIPPLTWVSDIAALKYNGFTPVFVDISFDNLALDSKIIEDSITENTFGIFITHILGFNGITNKLLEICKRHNLELIEDCCESHGAKFNDIKIGNIGLVSNFSFYFAHHMTTIEGGMISTNDKDLYHQLRRLRAHGMLRESGDEEYNAAIMKEHPDLHTEFIFPELGYNFRSNELHAVLGNSQLKRLDEFIMRRSSNFEYFNSLLNEHFFTEFDMNGQSNYAFIIILKNPNDGLFNKIIRVLNENKIEFRRGLSGGGNQLRQPYWSKAMDPTKFPVTEHIHNYSFYIGNYPDLSKTKIKELCEILNAVTV